MHLNLSERSSIFEQLRERDREGTELDPRYIRAISDSLAACLNLPVSVVTAEGDGPRLERLAKSLQNPFVEICRQIKGVGKAEWAQLRAAVMEEVKANGPTILRGIDGLAPYFRSALVRCDAGNLWVQLGPVGCSDLDGEAVLSDPDRRERLMAQIEETYAPGESRMSRTRAMRMMTQRSPIAKEDLIARAKTASAALQLLLTADVALELRHADYLDAVVRAVVFWTRQADPALEGRYRLMPEGVYRVAGGKEDCCPAVAVDASGALKLSPAGGDGGDWPDALISDWSVFVDTCHSILTGYEMEHLILIRLWAQDEFGLAITSEASEAQRRLFNRLAERINDASGADGCVIYQYLPGESPSHAEPVGPTASGYLRATGRSFAFGYLEETFKLEADHIESIGVDQEKRKESVCYRAIQEKRAIFLPESSGDEISLEGKRAPGSVLVVPMISRGRIWGVIEVLGKLPGQLPRRSLRWLEELSRVVTPILYTQWMLYHLREMSRIAMDAEPPAVKYEQVVDHVRKAMLASSARLYLQNLTRTAEFERTAHAGWAWPEQIAESFNLTDADSVSARCIEQNALWLTGTIGKGEFGEIPDDNPLETLGHRAAAVIPIRSESHLGARRHDSSGPGQTFASVFITSMDDDEFPQEWAIIVETIASHLSVIIEAVHLQERDVEAKEEYFAHTMKTRIDRVKMGSERLLALVSPLFGEERIYDHMPRFIRVVETALGQLSQPGRLLSRESLDMLDALKKAFPYDLDEIGRIKRSVPRAVADLELHLSELRFSAVHMAGGPNHEDPRQADPEIWKGTPALLRTCILESVKPISGTKSGRTIMVPDRAVLDWSVRVRVPEQIMIELINNLVDNALKYDFSPPSVAISVRPAKRGRQITLECRNLAPTVSAEEAELLRIGELRADYAMKKDKTGSGRGLKFAIMTAKQWGMDLTYDPPLDTGQALDWHVVRLTMENIGKT